MMNNITIFWRRLKRKLKDWFEKLVVKKSKRQKEEIQIPIYEKLAVNDCLIINKTESDLLIVCNKDGKPKIKRLSILLV